MRIDSKSQKKLNTLSREYRLIFSGDEKQFYFELETIKPTQGTRGNLIAWVGSHTARRGTKTRSASRPYFTALLRGRDDYDKSFPTLLEALEHLHSLHRSGVITGE